MEFEQNLKRELKKFCKDIIRVWFLVVNREYSRDGQCQAAAVLDLREQLPNFSAAEPNPISK